MRLVSLEVLRVAGNAVAREAALMRWLPEGSDLHDLPPTAALLHTAVVEVPPGASLLAGDAWLDADDDVGPVPSASPLTLILPPCVARPDADADAVLGRLSRQLPSWAAAQWRVRADTAWGRRTRPHFFHDRDGPGNTGGPRPDAAQT